MTRYRPTWAEINLDHLWYNIKSIRKELINQEIIPVIKANAYGHGAIPIFKFLIEKGVKVFAVSLLEEALELREMNQDVTILMMGAILEEDLEIASKNNIHITVYSKAILEKILNSLYPLSLHLKIDTGMHRYGLIGSDDILHAIKCINEKDNLKLEGIYTHFATANEDETFYVMQIIHMKEVLSQINPLPQMIHVSNSSSAFKYEKDYDFTSHIRFGISLYGLSLDEPKPDIKPVMTLKSKVVQIKELKPGDAVGYGATYVAKENEKIAILPIGYADGFIRQNKTGHVEIRKSLYKIIGIICMDACFIKVDDYVQVGDEVIIFGGQISIDDVAKRLNTINYEVTCQVSYRVPRIYIKGGLKDD